MENNSEEIEELKNEVKKQKKAIAVFGIIGLVLFVAIVAFGIGIFWIKSFDGTSKTGNTKSPFTTNTTDNGGNIDNSGSATDNASVELTEADLKNLYSFLDKEFLEDRYNAVDIFSDAAIRVRYVTSILLANNKAQLTTDDQSVYGQQLLYASVTDFNQTFSKTFGDNYNADNTTAAVSDFSIYNKCTSKPSVNDGQHVCWMGNSLSGDSLVATMTNKQIDNGVYVVDGKFTRGSVTGTYQFKYTISNGSLFIKSAVLAKN